MTTNGSPPIRYRLRGRIEGAECWFLLLAGDNRVGRSPENEVVLPVHGVSRDHAVIRLLDDGPVLEDLGSKNGVLVNGRRVGRARLVSGDEITIGSASLHLEPVDEADTSLAIALSGPAPSPRPDRDAGETTATVDDPLGLPAFRLVERFVAGLPDAPGASLAEPLKELCEGLRASGACVLQWDAHKPPAVVAAMGSLDQAWSGGRLEGALREAATRCDGGSAGIAGVDGPPRISCAVIGGPRGLVGLAVFGDGGDSVTPGPVLRVLVRLLARFWSPEASPAAPGGHTPGLSFPPGHVRGRSRPMAALYEQMGPVVRADIPVLLVGETGVGKEHLAQVLHLSSPRAGGPFVAVNCAAIPADLLESEMFGIGKGVATGVSERKGRFELAHGGTLLLDEIGEMPLALQAKLLRALQEKEIQPLGRGPVHVDVRVVAATNADLMKRVEEGRFRRDLYYRVAGMVLQVPPLRERPEDLPLLVEDFARRLSSAAERDVRGVTVKALAALTRYPWPGNVRELEHEIRRAIYQCPRGQAIDSTMLSPHVLAGAAAAPVSAEVGSLDLASHLKEAEARLIRAALARAGGNRSKAAKLLGISRNGLALKLARLEPGDEAS